jgi:hypothetical protein
MVIHLPDTIKGIETQIMKFEEKDWEYVRTSEVLFTVKLPAGQQSARNDRAGVHQVITGLGMGYVGSSCDIFKRIKEHLLGRGCKGLKGLRGGTG